MLALLSLLVLAAAPTSPHRVRTPGGPPPAPLGVAEQRAAEAVASAYTRLFGEPVPAGGLRVSAAGRVALPMAEELSPAALAAEWTREQLDTAERRRRATVARGPKGAYTHFLGSDPPGSDLWGEPWAIIGFLELAAGWQSQCAAMVAQGEAPRCTLQVGDISWYEDRRPDPLGHKDHRGGCLDLRLFRTDGSQYEAWWDRPDDRPGFAAAGGGYDRALTAAFVRYAIDHHAVYDVFFNDPQVDGVKPLPGHDDHLHLCVRRPAG
jgi:hypothetical protein